MGDRLRSATNEPTAIYPRASIAVQRTALLTERVPTPNQAPQKLLPHAEEARRNTQVEGGNVPGSGNWDATAAGSVRSPHSGSRTTAIALASGLKFFSPKGGRGARAAAARVTSRNPVGVGGLMGSAGPEPQVDRE